MTFYGVTFNPLAGVLAVPAFAAALFAVLPAYRLTARLNVLATTPDFAVRAFAVPRKATA